MNYLSSDIACAPLHHSHSSSLPVSTPQLPSFPCCVTVCLCRGFHPKYDVNVMTGKNINRKMVFFHLSHCFDQKLREERSTGFSSLIITAAKTHFTVLCCHGYRLSHFNWSIQAFGLHRVMGNSSQHCTNKKPALLSVLKNNKPSNP